MRKHAVRPWRVVAAGKLLRGRAAVLRRKVGARCERGVAAQHKAIQHLCHHAALVQERAVGAERRLQRGVHRDDVPLVKAGVALFQIEPPRVLGLRRARAADARGVIDGMRVLVVEAERKTFVLALVDADRQLVQVRARDRVLKQERLRVGSGHQAAILVGGVFDVEIGTLGTVVADVQDGIERQRTLDVQVVDLHQTEAVVRVDRVVVLDGLAVAAVRWIVGEAIGKAK